MLSSRAGLTPVLWAFIGGGIGGLFGLEAASYGAWTLLAVPVALLALLAALAVRGGERRRFDLAGFCIGAALVALPFAVAAGGAAVTLLYLLLLITGLLVAAWSSLRRLR